MMVWGGESEINNLDWPKVSEANSLFFGARALKIEFQSVPPSRPGPPLAQYITVSFCLSVVLCVPLYVVTVLLSLACILFSF